MFASEVEAGKVSVADGIARLRLTLPQLPGKNGDYALGFPRVFSAVLKRTNSLELAELEKILLEMPAGSAAFDDSFSAFASAKITNLITNLKAAPTFLKWEPLEKPLPSELANEPAYFQEAWKLHQTVIAPYVRATTNDHTATAESAKKLPSLSDDLKRCLGKTEPNAWKYLKRHQWGHWCGTGSDMLFHPRNRALLLSFLSDGKLHEAVGAALAQVRSEMMLSENRSPSDQWAIDLMGAVGVDWEKVMFGSLVPISGWRGGDRRPSVGHSFFNENDPWEMLAALGSDAIIEQCLELIRRVNPIPQDSTEFLTIALGPEPVETNGRTFMSSTPERVVALSAKTRSAILASYRAYLAPPNEYGDIIVAMGNIREFFVKDLEGPLRDLLKHPSHAVAAKALELLRESGLSTGQETIAPAALPIRVQLLLNGKPLNNVNLMAIALAERKPDGPGENAADPESLMAMMHATLMKTKVTTDYNGVFQLEIDKCATPEKIRRLRLSSVASYEAVVDVWPGPWIRQELAVQVGSKEVFKVEMSASDVHVNLVGINGLTPNTAVWVSLSSEQTGIDPEALQFANVNSNVGNKAVFRGLPAGKYKVFLHGKGVARYESEVILTAASPPTFTLDAKLEPGRNLRGSLVYPDGEKADLTKAATLSREGVRMQPAFEEWEQLPFGRYTLRIPSTRESETAPAIGRNVFRAKATPKEQRHDSLEKSFVIDVKTPPTLDLGEIVVPQETK